MLFRSFNEVQKMYQQSAKAFVEQYGDVAQILDPSVLGNFSTFFEAAYKKLPDYEEAQKIQKQQIKGTDDLTEKTVDAQKKMELFSQNMFKIANGLLPYAAAAVDKFADALEKITAQIIKILGGTTKTTGTPSASEARKDVVSKREAVSKAEAELANAQQSGASPEEIKKKEDFNKKLNDKNNEIDTLKDIVRQIIIAKSKNMINNNNK